MPLTAGGCPEPLLAAALSSSLASALGPFRASALCLELCSLLPACCASEDALCMRQALLAVAGTGLSGSSPPASVAPSDSPVALPASPSAFALVFLFLRRFFALALHETRSFSLSSCQISQVASGFGPITECSLGFHSEKAHAASDTLQVLPVWDA